MLHLRTQNELLQGIESRTRDGSNERWTEAEMLLAINDALTPWQNRVSMPILYSTSATWGDDTNSVDLPSYIDAGSITVQFRVDDSEPWRDALRYEVYPNATGGNTLQLPINSNVEWRIVHWAQNGQLPLSVVTLSDSIVETDTTLSIVGVNDIAPVGWLKIGAEWLQYNGITYGASSTALSNLVRGIYNTQADVHTAGDTVYFGVAAPQTDLYRQLQDQAMAYLHELSIATAATTDRDQHERMTTFYAQRAEAFWRRYLPQRAPKLKAFISELSAQYSSIGVSDELYR